MNDSIITSVISFILIIVVPFILMPIAIFYFLSLFLNPFGFWEKVIWFVLSFSVYFFICEIYIMMLEVID